MLVHSFWLGVKLIRADYWLLSLVLFGVILGPTMFAVTSWYSASEKVFLVRERCLLAEQETNVDN